MNFIALADNNGDVHLIRVNRIVKVTPIFVNQQVLFEGINTLTSVESSEVEYNDTTNTIKTLKVRRTVAEIEQILDGKIFNNN